MKNPTLSFPEQLKRSMGDLESIIARGQSPSGDGRFTVRTIEVLEPARHDAKSIKRIRRKVKLSQSLFAHLLGVSPALVRAWERGSRRPSPLARRLLDQVRARPLSFASYIRPAAAADRRSRKVA